LFQEIDKFALRLGHYRLTIGIRHRGYGRFLSLAVIWVKTGQS